jgi:tyrosyl-tRNA synthetase
MLMGLSKPASEEADAAERAIANKMSKSKPDTAIFMTDSEEEIKRKIGKAYCPEKVTEENPILEYCKYIIYERFDNITIKRPEKWGGNLELQTYDELVKVYREGNLHPMDLKSSVSEKINELIEPVREHFEKKEKAKKLLEQVKSFEITR